MIATRSQLVSVIRKRGGKEIEVSKNSIKQKDKEESQSKAEPVVSTLAGSLKSRNNNPKANLGNSSMKQFNETRKSLLQKKGKSVIKHTRRGIKRPMPKEFSMRKIRRRKRIRLDADGKLPS